MRAHGVKELDAFASCELHGDIGSSKGKHFDATAAITELAPEERALP